MSETRRGFLGKVAGAVAVSGIVPRLAFDPTSDEALEAKPTVYAMSGGWDYWGPRIELTDAQDWRSVTPRAKWERGE